ncbi:ATP-dependent DNA helicase RecG [Qingshengfaniella alkalisoli]|uniref:Probable DNA 3'-5' helicase RecG n=1 Tax=Qingshengfaniella alkalisoli TaxID=2599296 RepID=A0A5B8IXA2_9RHOB|nr:ATP-dependent DNA helicase RecG [Qingshengfaniella alkalisoli]QDY70253.1 ATP-dependent DNA helicase RecG [Qingshengfaniella alkalisoli]
MSGRPQILFPLFSALTSLDGVGPKTAQLLPNLGVEKPRDLLFNLPEGGIDRRKRDSVQGLPDGTTVTVEIEILSHHAPSGKGRPYRIVTQDSQTTLTLIWFHARAAYLENLLPLGARRVVSGKLELFEGHAQMAHPDYVVVPDQVADIPDYEPVYPLTAGLTRKAAIKAVGSALDKAPDLPEWIDAEFLRRKEWPAWRDALQAAHHPQHTDDLARNAPARARLAYDEFFANQLTLSLARARVRRAQGRVTRGDGSLQRKVVDRLGYALTGAQLRSAQEIAADLASDRKMYRLLQGDVGSGKTLVAFLSLLVAVEAGGQGVLMAPTEILARQHLESLQPLAQDAGVRLDILTGRDGGATRASKLKDVADGQIDVLVGTHAVFQADVTFHDLRLAVIDEQHRFGVQQRLDLGAKGQATDVLVMTATPIPRSLALTNFGDMDLSVLDEKPPGRTPVETALVSADKFDQVIARLRQAVIDGRQAYWVCPLVDDSETRDLVSAEDRFKRLRAALGDEVVGLVHGQMPTEQKDAAMEAFTSGKTRVLVATTVIEVGVNVPSASIMIIEHAEIFGLAQLHQLRGRVGRGAEKSTCLLLYHPPLSQSGTRRLTLLRDTEDGFRIAEEDLAMRGAGDLLGTAQSGLPRFRIADAESQTALLVTARDDARALLTRDPDLKSDRGEAARTLLWLLEQDRALRLLGVG